MTSFYITCRLRSGEAGQGDILGVLTDVLHNVIAHVMIPSMLPQKTMLQSKTSAKSTHVAMFHAYAMPLLNAFFAMTSCYK